MKSKKNYIRLTSFLILTGIAVIVTLYIQSSDTSIANIEDKFSSNEEVLEDKATTNAGRSEFFFNMLRSPITNQIPLNVRAKELAFAKNLNSEIRQKGNSIADKFDWNELGPADVGGRTRALGIDKRNSSIIIAGGVSGGIWKSIDGGVNWESKSDPTDYLGVSTLVQHPTNNDVWYYGTGELSGNSASETGAFFHGTGIFKSTDNGDTWNRVPGTEDIDTEFNSKYDLISKILVSPTSGAIFFSSNGDGIYKSTNDGADAELVLGEIDNHLYSDVVVTDLGTLYAVLSSNALTSDPTNTPGVYMSTDDGGTWDDITPAEFPQSHNRSVIGLAQSNQDIFYVFTDRGFGASGLKLFHFDVSSAPTIVTSDRSDGIPDFGAPVGDMNPQGGYNLLCKVLPNDPDFVILGTTNLIRSTDGFSTVPDQSGGVTSASEKNKFWIGGYSKANNISVYVNHHPDQHNIVFDPNNPVRVYSSHDGGISLTENITTPGVVWLDRKRGYNVTQFYSISIHPDADDPRIIGGAQDNGTPFFRYNLETGPSSSSDESSGDGAHAHLGENYALSSSQSGTVLKQDYSGTSLVNFSYVAPEDASNQLFIHPFAVNPADENYFVYPERNHLWRNNQMLSLARNTSNSDGTSEGWTELDNVNVGGIGWNITALDYTITNPTGRLYFAGSGGSNQSALPKVFRLDDVDGVDGQVDISFPGTEGDYISDIEINPEDGDEIIAIVSNYQTESIWHSTDAGATWSTVGGNLEGDNGPSVRAAAITPTASGLFYFVGTSTGLYATNNLNGESTVWTQESAEIIGQVVISSLDYRTSDGKLAVGTHGRGFFLGNVGIGVSNETFETGENPNTFALNQNYPNPFNPSTNINFSIPANSIVSLKIYDINGREVATVLDNKTLSIGSYDQSFDASSLASGTYLYRLEAIPSNGGQGFVESKTMTLIK